MEEKQRTSPIWEFLDSGIDLLGNVQETKQQQIENESKKIKAERERQAANNRNAVIGVVLVVVVALVIAVSRGGKKGK